MHWLLWLCLTLAQADDRDLLTQYAGQHPDPPEDLDLIEGYRFTGQLLRELLQAAERKPGVVRVEKIGGTHGRRSIFAFHVAEPQTDPERSVLIFAGIHPMEWISTEVAVDLLLELIEAPPRQARVTVIPVLNPDGRAMVESDLRRGELHRYRRSNGAGVDLNRNFAVHRESRSFWRHILPGYHSASGRHALSEPETQALDRLLDRHSYDRAASLHAFGGYFYYPWAGRFRPTPDDAAFLSLGRAMERAQTTHAYRPRQLGRWGFFFRAQGAEIDHLYGEHGVAAYLIELTRSGLMPGALKNRKIPFRWYNPARSAPHRARGVAALRALIRHPSPPTSPPPPTTVDAPAP